MEDDIDDTNIKGIRVAGYRTNNADERTVTRDTRAESGKKSKRQQSIADMTDATILRVDMYSFLCVKAYGLTPTHL